MKSPKRLLVSVLCTPWLLVLGSCTQQQIPSTEDLSAKYLSSEAFKELFPRLVRAKKVVILCGSPEDSGKPDQFTEDAAKGLADRIRAEGFRPVAFRDETKGPSVENVSVEEVSVFSTSSEFESEAQGDFDVKIHLKIEDHSLAGTFTKNEVSMLSSYSARLWIYGNDSDRPFQTSWSGSGNKSATGETPLEETPGWSIYGYPEDEDERISQFARECGAGALDGINQFGTQEPSR